MPKPDKTEQRARVRVWVADLESRAQAIEAEAERAREKAEELDDQPSVERADKSAASARRVLQVAARTKERLGDG